MPTPDLPELGSDGQARAVALAALRLADVAPTSVVEFVSRGRCLLIGAEAPALQLVRDLRGQLECTIARAGRRGARPRQGRRHASSCVAAGR